MCDLVTTHLRLTGHPELGRTMQLLLLYAALYQVEVASSFCSNQELHICLPVLFSVSDCHHKIVAWLTMHG